MGQGDCVLTNLARALNLAGYRLPCNRSLACRLNRDLTALTFAYLSLRSPRASTAQLRFCSLFGPSHLRSCESLECCFGHLVFLEKVHDSASISVFE